MFCRKASKIRIIQLLETRSNGCYLVQHLEPMQMIFKVVQAHFLPRKSFAYYSNKQAISEFECLLVIRLNLIGLKA